MSNVVPKRDRSATPPSDAADDETFGVSAPPPVPEPGTQVGSTVSRYVVLEEIGRGGMGRVLRAYDPKLQREVALKEVHAHQLDREATARLVAEARAMAKLSHPNVVAVYDVEERARSEVVLVMEYVAGASLKQWLRAEDRAWKDVVAHFVAAGRGLVAAHEAGLLHRDFKPANILVSSDGQVKVTDFGLAKVDAPRASADTPPSADTSNEVLTQTNEVMGTPRYMAPEQYRSSVDEPLTAAADQYAFCVALWEALVGEPPFTGPTMAKDKLAGPPSWPPARGITPRPVVEAVVRGLAPRPSDRWPTMEALLQALSWDPARRRNRIMAGVGAIGLLTGAGVAYDEWAQARASRCSGAEQKLAGIWDTPLSTDVYKAILAVDRPYATAVWERTKRELDAYAQSWAAMHTEACEATTVRGEQSPQMLDLRMACLHRAGQDLQATAQTLAGADEEAVRNAHKLTAGLRPLSRCADTEALAAEVEPPLPEEATPVESARTALARAKTLSAAGRYAAARTEVKAAKDALSGVEYGPAWTEVSLREGMVLEDLGEYEASVSPLREALGRASQWRQWEEMAVAATKLMYVVGYRQRRMEEALRYAPLALGLSRGHPRREAAAKNALALVLSAQGKYEEAEAEHRAVLSLREEALGPEHPDIAMSRNNLASALQRQGKYEEAEAEHRTALSLRETALGAEHPHVASSRNNLAAALYRQGKYEEAEAEHRAALSLRETALGPEHPLVATSRNNLATVLSARGNFTEAEAEHRAVLSLREKTLGPEHPHVGATRNNLANVLLQQGKYKEAEAEIRAALSIREKALGPTHPDVASSRSNLGNALAAQGKHAEAEVEHRAALSLLLEALGPDHPHVATARNNLAISLLELDRPADALPLAEQAWARRHQDDIPAGYRAMTAFVLARALWRVAAADDDRTRARSLAEGALGMHRAAGDNKAEEVQAWLEAHPPGRRQSRD